MLYDCDKMNAYRIHSLNENNIRKKNREESFSWSLSDPDKDPLFPLYALKLFLRTLTSPEAQFEDIKKDKNSHVTLYSASPDGVGLQTDPFHWSFLVRGQSFVPALVNIVRQSKIRDLDLQPIPYQDITRRQITVKEPRFENVFLVENKS